MLNAFLDESSSGDRDGVYVVAGYGSFVSTWRDFSDDWVRCLRFPPAIPYYRTANLRSEKWLIQHRLTRAEADTKTRHLAKIIEEYIDAKRILFSAHVAISQKEYRDLTQGKRIRRMFKEPYQWCFHNFVSVSLWHVVRNVKILGEAMDFVMDRNKKITDDAATIFKEIRRISQLETKDLMGDPHPAEPQDFAPLQAADMLAARAKDFYMHQSSELRRLVRRISYRGANKKHNLVLYPRGSSLARLVSNLSAKSILLESSDMQHDL